MLKTAFSSIAPLRVVRPARVVPFRRSLITAAAGSNSMVKATWSERTTAHFTWSSFCIVCVELHAHPMLVLAPRFPLHHADGAVLAESDKTEKVEGNHYFPPDSIKQEYFKVCEPAKLWFYCAEVRYEDLAMAQRSCIWCSSLPSGQQQDDGLWLEGDIKIQEH
jgi:Domain of unknown function (DUF427)